MGPMRPCGVRCRSRVPQITCYLVGNIPVDAGKLRYYIGNSSPDGGGLPDQKNREFAMHMIFAGRHRSDLKGLTDDPKF